jgi:phosphatidylinositol alpha-1,6-mannosyltransferase
VTDGRWTIPPHLLFLGLATYSKTGGLQAFNRRVINALARGAENEGAPTPRVHLLGDRPEDLPNLSGVKLRAFPSDRASFTTRAIRSGLHANVILVAHINLLPVAVAVKMVRPSLKLVLFAHGDEVWADPIYRRRNWLDVVGLTTVDRIAAVSRFTAGIMEREFAVPQSKFRFVPNAVDPIIPPPKRDTRSSTLLTVCRLGFPDRGKNVDAVIRALVIVLQQRPDARLQVVGEGPLRGELEALVRSLGIAHAVQFPGRLSDTDLQRAYAGANAFVMPSSKEGFGIVFLEAWRAGLPVIGGTEDAAPEIIADGVDGFCVDPQKTAALAKAMLRLLNEPELNRSMGLAGQAKVRSLYAPAVFEANIASLLGELSDTVPRSSVGLVGRG